MPETQFSFTFDNGIQLGYCRLTLYISGFRGIDPTTNCEMEEMLPGGKKAHKKIKKNLL